MSWRGIIDMGPDILRGEEIFHVEPIGAGPKGWFRKSELTPMGSHPRRRLSSDSNSNDDMDSDAEGKKKDFDDTPSPEHDTDGDEDGNDPTNVSDLFDPKYQSNSMFDEAKDLEDLFNSDAFKHLVELSAAQVLLQNNGGINAVDEPSAASEQNANAVSASSFNIDQSELVPHDLNSPLSKDSTGTQDAEHNAPVAEHDAPDAEHDAPDVKLDAPDVKLDTTNVVASATKPPGVERGNDVANASRPVSGLSPKVYLNQTDRELSRIKMFALTVHDQKRKLKHTQVCDALQKGGSFVVESINDMLFRIVSEKNASDFHICSRYGSMHSRNNLCYMSSLLMSCTCTFSAQHRSRRKNSERKSKC